MACTVRCTPVYIYIYIYVYVCSSVKMALLTYYTAPVYIYAQHLVRIHIVLCTRTMYKVHISDRYKYDVFATSYFSNL